MANTVVKKRHRIRELFGRQGSGLSGKEPAPSSSASVLPQVPQLSHPTPPDRAFSENALLALTADEQALVRRHLAGSEGGAIDDAVREAYDSALRQRKLCEDRRWRVTYRGRDIILRDEADTVVRWLQRFASVGDVVANVDPVHIGLPWAGIRLILEVASVGGRQTAALLSGLNLTMYMANRLRAYYAYLKRLPDTDTTLTFEKALVKMYALVLRFLDEAIVACNRHSMAQIWDHLRAESALDDFEKICNAWAMHVALDVINCDRELAQRNEHEARQWKERLQGEVRNMDETLRGFQDSLVLLHMKHDLAKLATVPQAVYDSMYEERLPRCLPGTRTALLQQILGWTSKASGKCVLWLTGPAGTGKSTIARTISHTLDQQRHLGTGFCIGVSFFFKRGEDNRGDAGRFFPTIAMQLADTIPGVGVAIADALNKDSFLSTKSLGRQFEQLIFLPLFRLQQGGPGLWNIVVVLDALDNCEHQEDVSTLLTLLPRIGSIISVNIRVFVTSRPELPIQLEFEHTSQMAYEDVRLEEMQAVATEHEGDDVRVYFEHEQEQIERQMGQPYQYKPLQGPQCLRILKLLPASTEHDTITACLEHWEATADGVRPNSAGSEDSSGYEALSWCWGIASSTRPITILEDGKTYTFLVSNHLYEALEVLRYDDRTRCLWVDSICIDQRHLEERNQQVAMMWQIYHSATNVCIWLGGATPQTKLALNFIKNQVPRLDSFVELCEDPKYINSWIAMLDLMKKQWFQRRWVVQEIGLARKATIHCGQDSIAWETFHAAVSLLVVFDNTAQILSKTAREAEKFGFADDFFQEIPALGATTLVEITNRLFQHSAGGLLRQAMSLEDIVSELAMFENSNPRDTIYAVLALAKDIHISVKIPDRLDGKQLTRKQKKALTAVARYLPNPYRKSYVVDYAQEVIDVYQQFIAFSISKNSSGCALDIILRPFAQPCTMIDSFGFNDDRLERLTEDEKHRFISLPSWIRDRKSAPFRRQLYSHQGQGRSVLERQHGDSFVGLPSSQGYRAAGSVRYNKSKVRFRKRRDHYSMFVEGFILDTVAKVDPASQFGNLPVEWLARREECEKRDPDIFWKTLVADRSPKGRAPLYYKNAVRAILEHVSQRRTIDMTKLIQEATSEILSGVMRQIRNTIWGRCLVVTKNGYLGLAPKSTREGDIICILYGCSVPVIMRRTDKTEKQKETELEDDKEDRLARQQKVVKILMKRYFAKRRKRHPKSAKHTAHDSSCATGNLQSDGDCLSHSFTKESGFDTALAKLNLAHQQHLQRITCLIVIACLVSHGDQGRLVASIAAILAVPHLFADTSTNPQSWQRYAQYLGYGILIMTGVAALLGFITASTWVSGLHAAAILTASNSLLPKLLATDLGRPQSRQRPALVWEMGVKTLHRVLENFRRSRSPTHAPERNHAPSSGKREEPEFDPPPLPCYYELVGESFFHGVMHGEAIELQNDFMLQGHDGPRIMSEVFELR